MITVLLRKPPIELILLITIGVLDLASTVILYMLGLIVELNPIMRPLLETSPALFTAVKMATLIAAYIVLQMYRSVDESFVKKASLYGTVAYVSVWVLCTSYGATAF